MNVKQPSKTIKTHWWTSFFKNRPIVAMAANFGLSAAAVACAYLVRYVFSIPFGPGLPVYITFYPAVILVFLLVGFWPGILSVILTIITVSVWELAPIGKIKIESPVDILGVALFSGTCLLIGIITNLNRSNQKKVALFEKEQAIQKSQEALHEHQERLAAIVEYSNDGIITKALDGRILTWNKGAEKIFGYSSDEAIGKPISIIIPNELLPEEKNILKRLSSGEHIDHYETIRRAKSGRVVDVSVTISPIKANDGTIAGASKIVRDISSRKQTEVALHQTEERYSITLAAVNDGIWDWHVPSGNSFFSPVYYALLGYTDMEFPANYASWQSLIHPEDIERVEHDIRQSIETGRGFEIALRMRMKSGEWLWVSTRGKTVKRDSDGKAERMVGTLSDITARKLTEQALLDKNIELDRFAYTVSHDLKSPLITIQAYAGMIKNDLETGKYERAQDDMKRIENAAGKMTKLLNDLLELSRAGRMMDEPSPVDMNRLVEHTLQQLAGPIAGSHVEIVLHPDLPSVLGDQKRIAEVMQNLIENAIKYMGDQAAPRIEIGTRQDGKECVFFVSDNGKGIDPSHHEKIFGLFKKLDAKSEGTGIGLALVKRIVEAHGGKVWVESEGEGKGSRFCFTMGS